MNIKEIAYRINEIGSENKNLFSKIQEIRNKYLDKKPRTWNPFAEYSVKDNYAFHSGGREELQFNIGEDFINGKTIFRFGIAFSLEQNQTLPNAKDVFKDTVIRFNEFVVNNPKYFSGFSFWYYRSGEFGEFFKTVKPISDEIFKTENFIFIGKYIEKKITEVTENDILKILENFDYLIPSYEKIQFGDTSVGKRISRLAYNSNGWVMPSGPYGKSKHKESHEANYGYGHEEWLLDTSKLIDGYHYGFLEPIRKQQDAYKEKIYQVWLYAIDGISKKRYWVGEINNLEVLSQDDAEAIKIAYKKNGWLKEMEEQIVASGANNRGFSDWKGVDLFNVRYKPENLKVNDPYFELPENHPIVEQSRYTFAHFKDEFKIVDTETELDTFSFSGDESEETETIDTKVEIGLHSREPRTIEITYLHKAISKKLTKYLKEEYGSKNVKAEHGSGIGTNKVDIIVNTENEGLFFYEIKTYNSVKSSIREAIGQLLEYAMWPNKMKANQLIIVTQKHNDIEKVKTYFAHLRSKLGLLIYFGSNFVKITDYILDFSNSGTTTIARSTIVKLLFFLISLNFKCLYLQI